VALHWPFPLGGTRSVASVLVHGHPRAAAVTMSLMIRMRDVHKRFGSHKALDGLCLEVPEGKVFGLIGPNGAGKTTTIRILSGLVRADRGEVSLNGFGLDPPHRIRRLVGALVEQPGLYTKLTLLEYLAFFARLYDLTGSQAEARIRELLELLDLTELGKERLQGFSLGMKQKAALARILLHDPPILLLDEPTSGLDPLITRRVRDFLFAPRERARKTVLVSTHNLDEARRVCDEVAVICRGRIVASGPVGQLGEIPGQACRVTVRLREVHPRLREVLEGTPELCEVEEDAAARTLSYRTPEPERVNPKVVERLVRAGAAIIGVSLERASLEEAYLRLATAEPSSDDPQKG